MPDWHEPGWTGTETAAGRVAVDPALGNIRHLSFGSDAGRITPLHTAPWVNDPQIITDEGLLPVERQLAGDFFCAPFGLSDVTDAPAHGWSANSAWHVDGAGAGELRLTLARDVMGASITKHLRLSADAPILYQEHIISGGSGGLTTAHHPMIHIGSTARFSCSTKRAVMTPDAPLEPGRNRLSIGQCSNDITHLLGSDGSQVDLTRLPIGSAHEDFVTLVEAWNAPLGWAAVVRKSEGDVIFFLKDPAVLPVTMLWHSNGGRDYSPWSGRHTNVLGVEDGCAAGAAGHKAALGPNRVSAEGVDTALELAPDRQHRIAHVIGAVPTPSGWSSIADIAPQDHQLILTGDTGGTLALPFDTEFLRGTQ